MRISVSPLVLALACGGALHGASPARDGEFRELLRKHADTLRECDGGSIAIVDITPSLPLCSRGEPPFAPAQCVPFTGRPGESNLCRVGDPYCCQMKGREQRCVHERLYQVCDVLRFSCDAQNGCQLSSEEPATFDRG